MNIGGGKGSINGDLPIYISDLRPDSVASKSGQIQVRQKNIYLHIYIYIYVHCIFFYVNLFIIGSQVDCSRVALKFRCLYLGTVSINQHRFGETALACNMQS